MRLGGEINLKRNSSGQPDHFSRPNSNLTTTISRDVHSPPRMRSKWGKCLRTTKFRLIRLVFNQAVALVLATLGALCVSKQQNRQGVLTYKKPSGTKSFIVKVLSIESHTILGKLKRLLYHSSRVHFLLIIITFFSRTTCVRDQYRHLPCFSPLKYFLLNISVGLKCYISLIFSFKIV